MNNKFLALALMIAVGFLPTITAHAQPSSAQTRANEILQRNIDRNAKISGRDAERLQRFDDEFEAQWNDRITDQVDATSLDIQAGIAPIGTTLENIKDRLTNVQRVLRDLGIPLTKTGTQAAASGVTGLVGYDVETKYDNFINCYSSIGTPSGCVVYDLPASGVEVDIAGIQPLTNQPESVEMSFLTQLFRVGGGGGPVVAGVLTNVGIGYATAPGVLKPWLLDEFSKDYRLLRDEATGQFNGPAVVSSVGGPTGGSLMVPCGRNNVAGVPFTRRECEFTAPEVFEKAVQQQVDKLHAELEVMEGTLINLRQAVRAFVHDVLEALEWQIKTQDSYDPRNGNPSYDPQDRQGSR